MPQLSLFDTPERVVVFDVETQRSFQDVGGRGGLHRLGVSLAVLYDYAADAYLTFLESDVNRLIDELQASTLVIGYNVKGFDYPVLGAYRPGGWYRKLPTLDLMEHLADRLGFRVGLDNVAGATLGKGKSGSGLDALRWYKEGRMDLIETYCRDDVEVTRRVYEYGKAHRQVKFRERNGEVRTVPVSW